MTFVIYTNIVSPHVVPLIEELREKCPNVDVTYIVRGFVEEYTAEINSPKKGWNDFCKLSYVLCEKEDGERAARLLRECDVLYSGFREVEVFEDRCKRGLLTYYGGERWLKPYALFSRDIHLGTFSLNARLPGILRWMSPGYRRMVRRFVRLLDSRHFVFLGLGVYAVADFVRLYRLAEGDWRCFFWRPVLQLEKKLMKPVEGVPNICLWGYFVAPTTCTANCETKSTSSCLRLLWVGRMMYLKRVDTVIKAVKGDSRFRLTLLGCGDDEPRLRHLARGCDNVMFHEPEDLQGVRRVMRENDVLVLSSNYREGWGAVVSEAIEEGLKVVGTYEAGSTATMLPETNLFHAGDVAGLRKILLSGKIAAVSPGAWSAKHAAEEFIKDVEARLGKK